MPPKRNASVSSIACWRQTALMPAVFELADHLASKSPFALAVVKEALRVGANGGQAEGIAYENKLFALCMQSDDKAEGVAAFLEKRSPTFTGR